LNAEIAEQKNAEATGELSAFRFFRMLRSEKMFSRCGDCSTLLTDQEIEQLRKGLRDASYGCHGGWKWDAILASEPQGIAETVSHAVRRAISDSTGGAPVCGAVIG